LVKKLEQAFYGRGPLSFWLWLFSHNFDRPLSTLIAFFRPVFSFPFALRLRCKKVEQCVFKGRLSWDSMGKKLKVDYFIDCSNYCSFYNFRRHLNEKVFIKCHLRRLVINSKF